jgi:succinate-semialdehyde dehydrogenase/glutarate-semialdehyde dehydrogenase
VCEYYAEHAEAFLADEEVETEASRSFVTFRPLGVVLAVMPWNFPFWQVFRFAAPGLMAGNAAVLKHASNVFGCALAIEDVFREAGFPRHLFRTLRIGSKAVDGVIGHPRVRAATLTGSVGAGRAVAKKAGGELKKTVLELGGSDPYLILEDADLDAAVETCVTSRLINSGQSCIAAKRFIVPRRILAEVEERFVAGMRAKTMGDPLDEGSDLGPQARDDLRDDLHRQVEASVEKGARLLLGGEVPETSGAWYPPTVLSGVGPGMPAYEEETFGPVAAIIPVADEEEAIRVANDSDFGLGAAVFTRDAARGEEIAARRLDAGCCFVNAIVKSDPRLPFGGVKHSGYGRELGVFGIREFVNVKTVWVE